MMLVFSLDGEPLDHLHRYIDIIERVHLKFCKLILNLKKSTPNFMIYGELGIYPMSVYIELRMINFLVKNGKWKG